MTARMQYTGTVTAIYPSTSRWDRFHSPYAPGFPRVELREVETGRVLRCVASETDVKLHDVVTFTGTPTRVDADAVDVQEPANVAAWKVVWQQGWYPCEECDGGMRYGYCDDNGCHGACTERSCTDCNGTGMVSA